MNPYLRTKEKVDNQTGNWKVGVCFCR